MKSLTLFALLYKLYVQLIPDFAALVRLIIKANTIPKNTVARIHPSLIYVFI